MNKTVGCAPEVRDRAVRIALEHQGEHGSQWAVLGPIAGKIGCIPETLRKWVRSAERDLGRRAGPLTSERERLKALELANELLRKGLVFRPGRTRPSTAVAVSFIDAH